MQRELERENRVLRQEREILKRAAALFIRESDDRAVPVCRRGGRTVLRLPAVTREQARLRVFWYIEWFYNPRRRHSSLAMLSPIDYEHHHQQEAIAA